MKAFASCFVVILFAIITGCSAGSDTIINANNASSGDGMSLSTIYTGSRDQGIFYSNDTGKSWSPAALSPGGHAYGIMSNGHYLFAATNGASARGTAGVYRSSDFGRTWSRLPGVADSNIYSLYLSGSLLLIGTDQNGIYRSTDEGDHWTNVEPLAKYVLQFAKFGSSLFASGDIRGVLRSTDNGVTWSVLTNGLDGAEVNSLAVMGQTIITGSFIHGTYRSTDNGDHWTFSGSSLPNASLMAVSGSQLYAATGYGFYHSSDSALTWQHIAEIPFQNAYSVATNGNYIFAPSEVNGMFISSNNGATWSHNNTGLTDSNLISVGFK